MNSSEVIHNVLSPLLTMPIPITVREMDLQHCLRCAKRAWFCPHMFYGELAGGYLGTGQQDALSDPAPRTRSALSIMTITSSQPRAAKWVLMEPGAQGHLGRASFELSLRSRSVTQIILQRDATPVPGRVAPSREPARAWCGWAHGMRVGGGMAREVGSGGPGGPDAFPCCRFLDLQSRCGSEYL